MKGHHEEFLTGDMDDYRDGTHRNGTRVRLAHANKTEPMFWLSGYWESTTCEKLSLRPQSILGVDFFTCVRDANLAWIETSSKV